MYAKCPAFRMIVHPFLPDPGQGVKLGAAAYCLEPKGQGLKDSHRPTTTRPIIPVIFKGGVITTDNIQINVMLPSEH